MESVQSVHILRIRQAQIQNEIISLMATNVVLLWWWNLEQWNWRIIFSFLKRAESSAVIKIFMYFYLSGARLPSGSRPCAVAHCTAPSDDTDHKDKVDTHKKMSFLPVCPPRMWPLRQTVSAPRVSVGWLVPGVMLPRQQVTHQFCIKSGGLFFLPFLSC